MRPKSYRCPFYPTQKVVCIKSHPGDLTNVGSMYVVKNVKVYSDGSMGLDLEETGCTFYYDCEKFRPA